MTSETAKALLMIFLFGSLWIAIHVPEGNSTKRLTALALHALRRAAPRQNNVPNECIECL
jgi:hypothetical protein